MMAGMDAKAHFTMKVTIDMKSMLTLVTATRWADDPTRVNPHCGQFRA